MKSGRVFKRTGIALVAGLAVTIAAPAISAQAAGPTTGHWSVMATFDAGSHNGCRIPDSQGNTINTYMTSAPEGVLAGLIVRDPSGAVVDQWSSLGSTDPMPSGSVYLPKGQGYTLTEWLLVGDGTSGGMGYSSITISNELARC